ncbi:MAG: EAL domain-containing protein [Clostridia bacterium]|nr:EAL domain-containing protein [Clostridia bacterium]
MAVNEVLDSYTMGKRIFDACSKIKESLARDRRPAAVLIAMSIGHFEKLKQEMSWADLEHIVEEFSHSLVSCDEHIKNVFQITDGEFVLLADSFENSDEASAFAECKFLEKVTSTCQKGDLIVKLKLYAGYVLFDETLDIYEMVDRARFALKKAVKCRANIVHPFEWEEYVKNVKLVEKRVFLKEVHIENQLYSVFQPIVNVRSGSVYGYEALSRTTNTVFSSIWELIECAKNTKYLRAINELMASNHLWTFAQLRTEAKKLFINMEAKTLDELKNEDSRIRSLIYDLGFSPSEIVLEFTERDEIDVENFTEQIASLRAEGILVAIDNYGTGGCSGLELIKIKPDIVKLDKEMISGIEANPYKRAFVQSILKFCEAAGVMLIAEGVETLEEAKTLLQIGVERMQGYFFARPQPTPVSDINLTPLKEE